MRVCMCIYIYTYIYISVCACVYAQFEYTSTEMRAAGLALGLLVGLAPLFGLCGDPIGGVLQALLGSRQSSNVEHQLCRN